MTRRFNANNERIKRQYFTFLKEAKRQSESTLDSVAKALARFEEYSRYRDFKNFHHGLAISFKKQLEKQTTASGNGTLSKATQNTALHQLRKFFEWLSQQPGYKSKLNYCDAEYFNLSNKNARIASSRIEKPIPTIDQIRLVLERMPTDTDIEKRNRALIAFTLLTGSRDAATASFKLKHVDLLGRTIMQDAHEVRTKFSKTFVTAFFPVGNDIELLFTHWVEFLLREKMFGLNDPIFPSTKVGIGDTKLFTPMGLTHDHWSSTNSIRNIFKVAFTNANLPYANPHSFRTTLVRLGEQICETPEDFKAWSQNLGHQGVMTTFNSYGNVPSTRQKQIIHSLDSQRTNNINRTTEKLVNLLNRQLNGD